MTATAHELEPVPPFGDNFDGFLDYLSEESLPAAISPRRFIAVLGIDVQDLANRAHVHRNTIRIKPSAEGLQRYLRDAIRVLRAATDISGSLQKSFYWFRNNPLPAFDYKTPEDLVSEGRTDNLIRYLMSLRTGFAG